MNSKIYSNGLYEFEYLLGLGTIELDRKLLGPDLGPCSSRPAIKN